ncbi:MAG: Unknown protein [uncultured Aureispira sp.]|uniref:Transport and Golgi organization protein 2 n=1 Tax=uncultured Aureispira sp. TaxID=1331704 RepID=A0A6S6UCT6_9BACT|nr:MAG: Unknown protein [uncultured Aureispira sp.]
MCTFTYIPTSAETFIWTQSRDESPLRSATGLFIAPNTTWVYPKEPQSGGTWIGMAASGRVVSLLNGAFEQNKYVPSIKSRGLMVLDFLSYPFLADFVRAYDFKELEPFTMMVYEQHSLWEFRWDKSKKHLKELDASKPHIRSSSTMYPTAIKDLRRGWFSDYLKAHSNPLRRTALDFHQHAGMGDIRNDLRMDRGRVKTISITSIEKNKDGLDMIYYNLVNGEIAKEQLLLQ